MGKEVYVVITLTAYVPDDMDLKEVQEKVLNHLEDNEPEFGISMDDYPDEDEQWVVFRTHDSHVGTSLSMEIGGIPS